MSLVPLATEVRYFRRYVETEYDINEIILG